MTYHSTSRSWQAAQARLMLPVAWAVDLLGQCQETGVPYFLKQLGSRVIQGEHRLHLEDDHGGEWTEWPAELRVREVPR